MQFTSIFLGSESTLLYLCRNLLTTIVAWVPYYCSKAMKITYWCCSYEILLDSSNNEILIYANPSNMESNFSIFFHFLLKVENDLKIGKYVKFGSFGFWARYRICKPLVIDRPWIIYNAKIDIFLQFIFFLSIFYQFFSGGYGFWKLSYQREVICIWESVIFWIWIWICPLCAIFYCPTAVGKNRSLQQLTAQLPTKHFVLLFPVLCVS